MVKNINGASFSDNVQRAKYLSIMTTRWHWSTLARPRTKTLGRNVGKRWFDRDVTIQTDYSACNKTDVMRDEVLLLHL